MEESLDTDARDAVHKLSPQPITFSRHKSRVVFIAIAFSILIDIAFHLDSLLGAVQLPMYYMLPGSILEICFPAVTFMFLVYFQFTSKHIALIFGGIFYAAVALLSALYPGIFVVLGWFGLIFFVVPIIEASLVFCFIVWFWVNLRFSRLAYKIMRLSVIGVPIFMTLFLLSIVSTRETLESKIENTLTFQGQYYVVAVQVGWLGDPDTLTLYQCNQFAMKCADVYHKTDYYGGKQIELVPNLATNSISIQVDGKTKYMYTVYAGRSS